MQDDYTTLEDVVRAQYANVFWTHKVHPSENVLKLITSVTRKQCS